jgi:propanol-preferring alcohol dehydrogenase
MSGVKQMHVPKKMRAMVLEGHKSPLVQCEIPVPEPGPEQVLIRIHCCGVCRTDLHIIDGELDRPKLPLIPGHEIAGTVLRTGNNVKGFQEGDRIGVPWVGSTCGECRPCRAGMENLCDRALYTGYTLDGGFAEYTTADQRYCFHLPEGYSYAAAAPLLCAGLIGYRSYRMVKKCAQSIGIFGFGAAAHIITQVAVFEKLRVYAFTRPGDIQAQEFALRMGAIWSGDSGATPPEPLDATIIFAPVGSLVPLALKVTAKGGAVVCGGIHMSDIPSFPYRLLWEERSISSVANLTRRDGEELLALAPKVPVQTEVQLFPLDQANEALNSLRAGSLCGAAVLEM